MQDTRVFLCFVRVLRMSAWDRGLISSKWISRSHTDTLVLQADMLVEAITRAVRPHSLPVRRWMATKSTHGVRGAPPRKNKREQSTNNGQIADIPAIDSQLIAKAAQSTSSGGDELKRCDVSGAAQY